MRGLVNMALMTCFLSGCSVWPYRSDFDCKTSEGLKCQSLYNVAKLADLGKFGPRGTITKEEIDLINKEPTKNSKSKTLTTTTTTITKGEYCNVCK